MAAAKEFIELYPTYSRTKKRMGFLREALILFTAVILRPQMHYLRSFIPVTALNKRAGIHALAARLQCEFTESTGSTLALRGFPEPRVRVVRR